MPKLARQMPKLAGKCPVTDRYYEHWNGNFSSAHSTAGLKIKGIERQSISPHISLPLSL